jgi:hypothetical protein
MTPTPSNKSSELLNELRSVYQSVNATPIGHFRSQSTHNNPESAKKRYLSKALSRSRRSCTTEGLMKLTYIGLSQFEEVKHDLEVAFDGLQGSSTHDETINFDSINDIQALHTIDFVNN